MTAKEIFTRAVDDIFNVMARDAVKYKSTNGVGPAVEITAILKNMDPSIMSDAPPGDSMVLHVKTSEVSNPQRGDTFTISEETWYMRENLGGGPHVGTWKLEISRSDKRQF